jgi:hypothetical protein
MKKYFLLLITLFVLIVTINSCTKDKTTAATEIDCSNISSKFNSDINPILNSNKCSNSNCHGGAVVSIVGYSNVSKHLNHINDYVINRSGNPMPPSSSPQLTVEELNKIKCWKQNNYPNN